MDLFDSWYINKKKVSDKGVDFYIDDTTLQVYLPNKKELKVHSKNNHNYVYTCKHAHQTCHSVAHLVATAFLANPNQWKYVRHLNGHTFNNHPHNLEWCPTKPYIKQGSKYKPPKTQVFKILSSKEEAMDYLDSLNLLWQEQPGRIYPLFKDGELMEHFRIFVVNKGSFHFEIRNIPFHVIDLALTPEWKIEIYGAKGEFKEV